MRKQPIIYGYSRSAEILSTSLNQYIVLSIKTNKMIITIIPNKGDRIPKNIKDR